MLIKLKCPRCGVFGEIHKFDSLTTFTHRLYSFYIKCPKCYRGIVGVRKVVIHLPGGVRVGHVL